MRRKQKNSSRHSAPKYQRPSRRRHKQNSRLLALPPEILVHIAKNLRWRDVLVMRQVCKQLFCVSQAKEIWSLLFLEHLAHCVPKPHGLTRNILTRSSSELEQMMKFWNSNWLPNSLTPRPKEIFVNMRRHSIVRTMSVPGGRWVILGISDGSISCLDLESASQNPPGTLKPLIPSPVKGRKWDWACHRMIFAMDMHPDLSQTSSLPRHETGLLPASRMFNLAALSFFCVVEEHKSGPRVKTETILQVWKIEAKSAETCNSPDNVEELVALECLARYREVDTGSTSLSLYGRWIAYDTCRPRWTTFVVDWTIMGCSNHGLGYERLYMPGAMKVYLLPNERLLGVSAMLGCDIDLWEMRYFHKLAGEPGRGPINRGAPSPSPSWSFSAESFELVGEGHHLYFIHNSSRFVIGTNHGVVGIIIPDDFPAPRFEQGAQAVDVEMVTLLDANFDGILSDRSGFSYRRAVVIRRNLQTGTLVQYRWPDDPTEEVPQPQVHPLELRIKFPIALHIHEALGRIVVAYGDHFDVVTSTPLNKIVHFNILDIAV